MHSQRAFICSRCIPQVIKVTDYKSTVDNVKKVLDAQLKKVNPFAFPTVTSSNSKSTWSVSTYTDSSSLIVGPSSSNSNSGAATVGGNTITKCSASGGINHAAATCGSTTTTSGTTTGGSNVTINSMS